MPAMPSGAMMLLREKYVKTSLSARFFRTTLRFLNRCSEWAALRGRKPRMAALRSCGWRRLLRGFR
jgi:hypothetical protein